MISEIMIGIALGAGFIGFLIHSGYKEYTQFKKFKLAYNAAKLTMVIEIEEVQHNGYTSFLMYELFSNKFLGQEKSIEDLYALAFNKFPSKNALLVKLPGNDETLSVIDRAVP